MVDQGYRGHGYAGSAIVHVVRTISKRATRAIRRMLKHRAAIETAFRIPKSDLSSRPIWHQKEDRVLAHLLVCFLAYGLWKFLGRNSASKPASVTNRGGCWQRCVSYAAWT